MFFGSPSVCDWGGLVCGFSTDGLIGSSKDCAFGFLIPSSLKLGSKYLLPTQTNNSSIPIAVQADVSLNIAPISSANFLAFSSGTVSSSNKSLLFAANPITI